MMDRETLTKTMSERLLTMGEILSTAYSLLSNRFGQYLGLSFLVFLPISALVQYFSMKVDVSSVDLEAVYSMTTTTDIAIGDDVIMSMLRYMLANLCAAFLSMIAVLVVAVIVKNQLFDEENRDFGTLFYRGVRMWPRAALTLVIVLIQMVTALICCSMMLTLPLAWMIAFVLLVVVVVRYMMQMMLCGNAAALRARMGFDNLRYVRFLVQRDNLKLYGIFAVVILISDGISLLVSLMCSNLFYISANVYAEFAIAVTLSTLLSILSVYGYVCGSIVFLNLEEVRRTALKKMALQSQNINERHMAEESLEAMDEGPDDEQDPLDRKGD